MSMIENHKLIKDKGIAEFLKDQTEKYRCPKCSDIVSVHDGKCYACGYQGEKPKGSIPKCSWVPNKKKIV
jgi:rubrerythrin